MELLFDQGSVNGKNIILFHGTGGNEHTLVSTARFLDEESSVLSFRGEKTENGMNCFYKRGSLQHIETAGLKEATTQLLEEIRRQSEITGISMEDWIFVGYSSGANIAASLLLSQKTKIRYGILFHPMSLGQAAADFTLADKKIWMSYGVDDPIVDEAAFGELAAQFEQRQADVTAEEFDFGPQVTMDELESAKNWLEGL